MSPQSKLVPQSKKKVTAAVYASSKQHKRWRNDHKTYFPPSLQYPLRTFYDEKCFQVINVPLYMIWSIFADKHAFQSFTTFKNGKVNTYFLLPNYDRYIYISSIHLRTCREPFVQRLCFPRRLSHGISFTLWAWETKRTLRFKASKTNVKRKQLSFFAWRWTAKRIIILRLPRLTLVHWKTEMTYVLKGVETMAREPSYK